MRTLIDFIFENNSYINFNEWNPAVNYSFEDFCLDNDVDIDDSAIYNEALKTFNNHHWENYCFGEKQDYKYHQELFYETLNKSLNSYRFIEKIKDYGDFIISVNRYSKGTIKDTNKFMIEIVSSEIKFLEDVEFKQLLNLYNYIKIYDEQLKDKTYSIILRPYVSEEKTKLIHDEEYIYHLTSNNCANKIEKFGLHPKSKSEKIQKIYVLRKNKDFHLHLQGLMGNEQTKVLFKIDVSKLPKDMKFFLDDGATGYDAYYTFEPISPNAIADKEIIENDKFKL